MYSAEYQLSENDFSFLLNNSAFFKFFKQFFVMPVRPTFRVHEITGLPLDGFL